MICGLLKPLLLYFCDPSVDGLSYHTIKLAKLINSGGGVAAALFSSRCPKNLQNEKISSTWKLLKLTWGVNFGSRRTILDMKTQFKVKPIFWG